MFFSCEIRYIHSIQWTHFYIIPCKVDIQKAVLGESGARPSSYLLMPSSTYTMGRMAFVLRRWRPHEKGPLLPIIMLPDGGFILALYLYVMFEFWLFGRSVCIEKTMVRCRNVLRMNTYTNITQRSTKHLPCHSDLHHTRGVAIAPVVLPSYFFLH